MMMTLHRLMRDQLTADSRAYEIVEEAVEQKWPPIVDYLTKCAAMLAEAIADGQASGEFGPGDPLQLGWMTMQSCVVIHDPTLIPSCKIIRPDAKPEEAIDFALRALANLRPPAPIPET